MNASHSPRWFCTVVRAFGDGVAASGRRFGARHIARCPDCAAYFGRADAIDRALRGDARAMKATPVAGLDDRIMAAVMRSARDAEYEARDTARPAKTVRFALAFAGGVAAVAIIVGMILSTRDGPPVPIDHVAPLTPSSPTMRGAPAIVRPAVALLPQPAATAQAIAELATPVKSALAQDPLQTEAKSVYADARSAVQFLALNFLPSGALAQNEGGRANGGG
jgi:hypothetical protein